MQREAGVRKFELGGEPLTKSQVGDFEGACRLGDGARRGFPRGLGRLQIAQGGVSLKRCGLTRLFQPRFGFGQIRASGAGLGLREKTHEHRHRDLCAESPVVPDLAEVRKDVAGIVGEAKTRDEIDGWFFCRVHDLEAQFADAHREFGLFERGAECIVGRTLGFSECARERRRRGQFGRFKVHVQAEVGVGRKFDQLPEAPVGRVAIGARANHGWALVVALHLGAQDFELRLSARVERLPGLLIRGVGLFITRLSDGREAIAERRVVVGARHVELHQRACRGCAQFGRAYAGVGLLPLRRNASSRIQRLRERERQAVRVGLAERQLAEVRPIVSAPATVVKDAAELGGQGAVVRTGEGDLRIALTIDATEAGMGAGFTGAGNDQGFTVCLGAAQGLFQGQHHRRLCRRRCSEQDENEERGNNTHYEFTGRAPIARRKRPRYRSMPSFIE